MFWVILASKKEKNKYLSPIKRLLIDCRLIIRLQNFFKGIQNYFIKFSEYTNKIYKKKKNKRKITDYRNWKKKLILQKLNNEYGARKEE